MKFTYRGKQLQLFKKESRLFHSIYRKLINWRIKCYSHFQPRFYRTPCQLVPITVNHRSNQILVSKTVRQTEYWLMNALLIKKTSHVSSGRDAYTHDSRRIYRQLFLLVADPIPYSVQRLTNSLHTNSSRLDKRNYVARKVLYRCT